MENATPGKEPKKPIGGSPSDHLANERTYLARVRTSIGIMAFGFVVVVVSHRLSTMLAASIVVVGILLVVYLVHSVQ